MFRPGHFARECPESDRRFVLNLYLYTCTPVHLYTCTPVLLNSRFNPLYTLDCTNSTIVQVIGARAEAWCLTTLCGLLEYFLYRIIGDKS